MADLILFKRYLENEDIPSIRQFLSECDGDGASEGLRQAGDFFGFPTVEIEGVRPTRSWSWMQFSGPGAMQP